MEAWGVNPEIPGRKQVFPDAPQWCGTPDRSRWTRLDGQQLVPQADAF